MDQFKVWVALDTIEKVKNFANDVFPIQCEVDLASGRYVVDARSIMGIFSLDLSKPILLIGYPKDDDQVNSIKTLGEKYGVN